MEKDMFVTVGTLTVPVIEKVGDRHIIAIKPRASKKEHIVFCFWVDQFVTWNYALRSRNSFANGHYHRYDLGATAEEAYWAAMNDFKERD